MPSGAQMLRLGARHACVLVVGGNVRCWGLNDRGQLGIGNQQWQLFDANLAVLQSSGGRRLMGVLTLALSGDSSCAILAGGAVRCWGDNSFGQLGDDTTTLRRFPVSVLQSSNKQPLTDVQALALGARHSCGLLAGGEVRCWGDNSFGQLGDGTTESRLTSTSVLNSVGGPPLTGVRALALGARHSCGLLVGGEVRCWGDNSSGQLGDGTMTSRLNPVVVAFP
jgi:alpha-tubulin suppressor-like RCC1 family protein